MAEQYRCWQHKEVEPEYGCKYCSMQEVAQKMQLLCTKCQQWKQGYEPPWIKGKHCQCKE